MDMEAMELHKYIHSNRIFKDEYIHRYIIEEKTPFYGIPFSDVNILTF